MFYYYNLVKVMLYESLTHTHTHTHTFIDTYTFKLTQFQFAICNNFQPNLIIDALFLSL
jgi:hypothetical protein